MNLDKSLAFYKDRFADASDFTSSSSAASISQTMKPLVERYLGSLPSLHRNESGEGRRHPSAGGRRRAAGEKRHRPRGARSASSSPVPFQNDETHRVVATRDGGHARGNLQRTLREDLGGTYGVSVVPRFTKRPTGGVPADDHIRLRPGADREPGQDARSR